MTRYPFDFSDKVVFVAGGTSGINLGIAEGFAKAGATLAVLGRSQDKIDKAIEKLRAHGGRASGFSADVRDTDRLTEVFTQTHEALGLIDVLVSGAAGNFPAAANEMSANAFKAVVDIDLLGTFNVLRYSYQYLRKPGANIINISAPQSFIPMEMQAHVCAAKAGVDMITRTTAMEWGPEGIRVNSLVPGPIQGTEGMKRLAPQGSDAERMVIESVPMRRQGVVEDLASAALFVASDMASYITGTVIPVDGGWGLGGAGQLGSTLVELVKKN